MGEEIPEIDNDDYLIESVADFLVYWADEICSASRDEAVEALCMYLKGNTDKAYDILEKHI